MDWIWLDEECPMDIYTEALTRTNIGGGPVWMTFTPLLGMSDVVRRFLQEKSPYRLKEATPIEHAAALRAWGKDLTSAWPCDGKRETLEGAAV